MIVTIGQESRSGPYSVRITPYGAVSEDRFKVEITYCKKQDRFPSPERGFDSRGVASDNRGD